MEKFPVDFRGVAIRVCHSWGEHHLSALKQKNSRGLVKRSALSIGLKEVAGWIDSQNWRSEDEKIAALAVVDWIGHQISIKSKFIPMAQARVMCRFFWGYLERSSEYAKFYAARGGEFPWNEVNYTFPQPCFVGYAHGAPTLGHLFRFGEMKSGLGFCALNNKTWSILSCNRQGRKLLELVRARDRKPFSEAPKELEDEVCLSLIEMGKAVMNGESSGPQWLVFDGSKRLVFGMKMAREQGGSCLSTGSSFEDRGWRLARHGLLSAMEDMVRLNFLEAENNSSGNDPWGTHEHLKWHLQSVDPKARRHHQIFKFRS